MAPTADDALVVLAGGRSLRFGSDKAVAAFDADGEPLALRMLRRLSPLAGRRVIVRGAELPGLSSDVVRVADPHPGEGPLQALAAAFRAAPARRWFVAPCDLPLLDVAIYRRLEAELGDTAVVCAATPIGIEPLVSIWTNAAASVVEPALAAEPRLAVHALLERLPVRRVSFLSAEAFVNVNTPNDLRHARARRVGPPSVGLATKVAP